MASRVCLFHKLLFVVLRRTISDWMLSSTRPSSHMSVPTLHGSSTQYHRPYHTPWNRQTKVNRLQEITGVVRLGSSFDSESKSNRLDQEA
jgi:hypothetical protein